MPSSPQFFFLQAKQPQCSQRQVTEEKLRLFMQTGKLYWLQVYHKLQVPSWCLCMCFHTALLHAGFILRPTAIQLHIPWRF